MNRVAVKMSPAQYIGRLQGVLHGKIFSAPTAVGGVYEITEPGQSSFLLDPVNLSNHFAVDLQKLKADWVCFRPGHPYAHRRCDKVVVTWVDSKNAPLFFLFEMKSGKSNGAWTQLQASMAFCQFAHGMAMVNAEPPLPEPIFGAVTLKNYPITQKNFMFGGDAPNRWQAVSGRPRCWRMTVLRSVRGLRLKQLLGDIEQQL